jgi:hypothetical protein
MLTVNFVLQPILVFMSKVDGKFQFSPISVNFLTEVAKVIFAIVMLVIEVSLCSFVLSSRVFFFMLGVYNRAVKYINLFNLRFGKLGKYCKKLFSVDQWHI